MRPALPSASFSAITFTMPSAWLTIIARPLWLKRLFWVTTS